MTYFRSIYEKITRRLQEESPLIQVVIGPRQVGKTTAIRQALDRGGLYETADSPTPLTAKEVEGWWRLAETREQPILAIDEIQKISGWSEIIKKLWDSRAKPLKLVLSGSAALAIEKNLKESLAGRYELIRAEHWNFREAQKVFKLNADQFIEFGCYPGAVRFLPDLERWAEYVRDSIIEPIIGRDIIQLHPVDKPALLRQLFGVAASLPAQIVSLNKLQGQLQEKGALTTIQHYLELLAHGFMVTGLQKYSKAQLRTRSSSPKLIVHDNALLRALRRPVDKSLTAELQGRYFENAIIARFVEAGWETYYWKDRDAEVDLVALGPRGEKLAIEIKTAHERENRLTGLHAFCRLNSEFEPCLVSRLNQQIVGVKTIAVESALGLSRESSLDF